MNDDVPEFITSANFTLNTDTFKYKIILNTWEITSDFYQFINSFGEGTCDFKANMPARRYYILIRRCLSLKDYYYNSDYNIK